MADLITDPDNPRSGTHSELEKAEISKSEQAVVRVIDAVKNFTNPFTIADKKAAVLPCFRCACSLRC